MAASGLPAVAEAGAAARAEGGEVAVKRLRAIWRRIRHGRGPLVDFRGFPTARHPESLDRELPQRDEDWLAEVAAELWPEDEYVEFVRRDPPEGSAR
jgi:hypothetical protein